MAIPQNGPHRFVCYLDGVVFFVDRSLLMGATTVILTDLDMPEMDGFRFIKNIKKKNCKCRHVAVMSGDLNAEAMYQAVKLGCSAFEKPLDKESLFSWLENIERTGQYSRERCDWFAESTLSAAG
jgi:DNA-binding NtrC family response regulator